MQTSESRVESRGAVGLLQQPPVARYPVYQTPPGKNSPVGPVGVTHALPGSFCDETVNLSWNKAATVVPFVARESTAILTDMAAGGVLHLRRSAPSARLVCLGMEGNTSVQGLNGITLILPGRMEVLSAEPSLIFRSRLGSRGIVLLVPREKLRLKPRFSGPRRSNPSEQSLPISLNPDGGSLAAGLLRDCVAGIAAQIADGGDRQQIERAGALVAVLLRETLSETHTADEAMEDGSIPWYVAAAEQHLRRQVSNSLSVKDLARAAGVSPRTLHDGFRKHRRTSPMKLLRAQRMQMVRKELTEPDKTRNVTDSALKWGFNHLGRFSAYYLTQFGEKPSETLRVSRTRR